MGFLLQLVTGGLFFPCHVGLEMPGKTLSLRSDGPKEALAIVGSTRQDK